MKKQADGVKVGGATIREASLEDFTPDPNNVRNHSPNSIGAIRDSIHEVGAARSLVSDERGVILAGNGSLEAALEAGLDKAIVVETDGETMVIVQRSGLSEFKKKRLSLADNAIGEQSEWNYTALHDLSLEEDPALLDGLFTPAQMNGFAALAEQEQQEAARAGEGALSLSDTEAAKPRGRRFAFRLEFDSAEQKKAFDRFLGKMKFYFGSEDDTPGAMWAAFLHEHHADWIGDE